MKYYNKIKLCQSKKVKNYEKLSYMDWVTLKNYLVYNETLSDKK